MSYLAELDQTPDDAKWAKVRNWLFNDAQRFTAELRAYRPVLKTPVATVVARHRDCDEVLRRHETFGNDLYKPKQDPFWMQDNDTARHWREKSVMKAVLDKDDIGDIRDFVAEAASDILDQAGGTIEVVNKLSREVPLRLVQERFGFDGADRDEMFTWSYWQQVDAFKNQPMDAVVVPDPGAIVAKRQETSVGMRDYIVGLYRRRVGELQMAAAGQDVDIKDDPVTKLIRLQLSGAIENFAADRVILNIGGLLIGAVETTSEAVVYALEQLLKRPDVSAAATEAARARDPNAFDGYVWEALRFKPIAPYIFRQCNAPATIGTGRDYATEIAQGEIVLACIASANFDPTAYPDASAFRPDRPFDLGFHFGQGLHQCLGRHIGRVMIPEIVRQCLRRDGFETTSGVQFDGRYFPERFECQWQSA